MYKNKSLIKLTNPLRKSSKFSQNRFVSFIIEFIKENPLVHRIS